jgi:anti-anti-sigma factor
VTLRSEIAVQEPNFRTAGRRDSDRLEIRLEGEASIEALDALGRVLALTHEEAVRLEAKEVVMNLTQLEFMSSSGLKHFVRWLRRACELGDGKGYRIRLVSSPLVPWQRRGLEALRCFAPQRVTVETAAES